MIDVHLMRQAILDLEAARDSAWLAAGWAKTWGGAAHARDAAKRCNDVLRSMRTLEQQAWSDDDDDGEAAAE